MQDDEAAREQPEEAVHVFEREPRPALQTRLHREQEPCDHRRGQQREGQESACARHVPGLVGGREGHAARASPTALLQVSLTTMRPPSEKRPGRPRPSSQSGPPSESRKAACAAATAARQEEAATVTSYLRERAGRPVPGWIRWFC